MRGETQATQGRKVPKQMARSTKGKRVGAGRLVKHFCMTPGHEDREAFYTLNVRLRRPDTSSVWAPSTGAYLCDECALAGGKLELIYTPALNRRSGTPVVRTETRGSLKGAVGEAEIREMEIAQE